MAIYAIGDLHLAHQMEKPMDIFGEGWIDHTEKLKTNWTRLINEEDLVIIPGDISWAMDLEEVKPDLNWLASLPGSKLLVKGNHDYWWSSISKVRALLPKGIFALQNDHLIWGDSIICGTRGWLCPGEEGFDNESDEKLYLREVQRLRLSLESVTTRQGRDLIVALHFPPFNRKNQASYFTEMLEEFAVSQCLFGHIHDQGRDYIFQGERRGVLYRFVAADGLDFRPLKII